MKRKVLMGIAVLGLALSLAACTSGSSGAGSTGTSAGKPLKVAFILDGPLNDGGFDSAINVGMQEVMRTFGGRVQVTYKLNVPENPQAAQVINGLVQSGNQMIFATSFGYHTFMAAAAARYPSVKFLQYESTELRPNLSESYIGIDQAWYLAGMAAGALAKNGKLGFVGSFPIPALLIQVNGFELGARAVNPNATTRVIWGNSWYNPSGEAQEARSLVSSGAEVLADGADDPTVVQTAEQLGVPVVGHDLATMAAYAPKQWVTAALFLFGPYYVAQIRAELDGHWHSASNYGLMSVGATGLAPFGAAYRAVPARVRQEIAQRQAQLQRGTFDDLTGPIMSQSGAVEIPAGQHATVAQRESMSYLVHGVLGSV